MLSCSLFLVTNLSIHFYGVRAFWDEAFFRFSDLLNHRETRPVKNLIYVKILYPQPFYIRNVGRCLVFPQVFVVIGKYILERNLMFVRNVEMSSVDLEILLNSGEKLHQCLLCGKAFTLSLGLSMLMRICTGEKPYLCEECGKAFIHSSAFIWHMKMHTEEKPFVFKECWKAFSQSVKVTKHWEIHSGENPQAVRQVGRPLVCPHNLLSILKFTVVGLEQ